ncbi:MAG: peptidoglycan-binding domain-containing protein, partial [Micromonosporaceae bacterium]
MGADSIELRARSRRVLLAIAGVAVLASGSLIAAAVVRSPAQSQPPSALTAPVLRKVLTRTVVIRGTVVAASVVAVTAVRAPGAPPPVVTRLVKGPGDAIEPGDVVIEVSGRPLIALPGVVPARRDLRPGDSGADVAQLQAALRQLGYPGGDPSASFGPGTKAAITQLYRRLGYAVPTTGGRDDLGDLPALRAAAQAVSQARQFLARGEQRVAAAQADLTEAQSAHPRDPTAVDHANAALAVAATDLRVAADSLARAQQAQRQAIATTGALMPLSEVV